MNHFAAIATERRRLADDLRQLDDTQLETQSLCGGWTVRQVATHLTMPFQISKARMVVGMLANRGDFNEFSRKWSVKASARPFGEVVELLHDNAEHRFTPPGLDSIAPLSDIVVHSQDIRRPLGIEAEFPEETTSPILDAALAGTFKRLLPPAWFEGLRFDATDTGWSTGEGPGVEGSAEALTVACWGRAAALADLKGDGVDQFRSRVSA